jgi:prevent-host-death family protein
MTTIPVQDLKQNLAAWLARVAAGERFTITRRNRPVAELAPVAVPGVHTGERFGRGRLLPLGFSVPTGAVDRVIAEDRSDGG